MNSDEKRGVERFRRVKEEEVAIDDRVVDNSFEAKVSVLRGSVGEKFKEKEKNKCWTQITAENFLFRFFTGH